MSETTTDLVEQAGSLRASFDSEVEQITGAGYAEDVQKAHLGVLYAEYRQKMDTLRERFDQVDQKDRLARGRDAFGIDDLVQNGTDPAVNVISYRDALIKAGGIFEEKNGTERAIRLLDQAVMIGDEVLARAIATTAFRRNHDAVVEAYEALHPGWTERAQASRDDKRNTSVFAAIKFRLPKISGIAKTDISTARKNLDNSLTKAAEQAKKRNQGDGFLPKYDPDKPRGEWWKGR